MASSASRAYTFRLSSEGLDKLKRDMEALGPAGAKALDQITASVPQLQNAYDRAQRAADEARKRIEASNDNAARGFGRVGEAADRMEAGVKRSLRGLNDVRGTMELLGPLAGEAGSGFGSLVRVIGNVGDAFGVFSTLVRANPLGVLITGAGLAATAVLTLGGGLESAAAAQKKYDEAVKVSSELMETASERTQRLAAETRRKTLATLEDSLAVEQRNVSQLKAARLAEQQLLLSNPQLKRDDSIFGAIDAQLRERQSRATDLEQRIKAAQNPANDGAAREAAAKEEETSQAEAQKQYLADIDARIAAEEEAMRTVAASKQSHHQLRDKIAKESSEAQQKLAEEDAKVLQESAKLTADFQIKEAERRDREVFGSGAMRAAQDYWQSLSEHGRRAGQFVTGSVLRPMEDQLTKFFATGKGKISDFFDAVKMGVARLAAQDVIGGIGAALGLGSGGGSAIASGVSFLSGLFFEGGGRPPVGRAVVVGEKGPEIAVFDQPATIYSHEQSRAMLRQAEGLGQGGDNRLIHVMDRQLPAIASALGHDGRRNPHTGLLGFADSPDGGFGGSTDTGHDTATGSNAGIGSSPANSGEGGLEGLDIPGLPSLPGIGGGSARGLHGDRDDRAVAAYNQAREMGLSVDMASRVASLAFGLGPTADFASLVGRARFDTSMQGLGLFGRLGYSLGNFFGIGQQGGFLGSRAAGGLVGFISTLLGMTPLGPLAAGLVGVGLNTARGMAVGGPVANAGLANMLSEAISSGNFGRSIGHSLSQSVDRIGTTLGLDGSRSLGATPGGRFGGFDLAAGQFGHEGLSMGGAARGAVARGDLAADLGSLRGSLAGDWSGVVATGQNVLASLPRFHTGGSFEVPAGGEVPVAFMAETGERVSVQSRRQVEAGDAAAEAITDALAALGVMLRGELRALRTEFVQLSRRGVPVQT